MNIHVPFSRFHVSDFTDEESNYLRIILGKRKHTFYDAWLQLDFSHLLDTGKDLWEEEFETHLLDSNICILEDFWCIEQLADYILSTTPIFVEAQDWKYMYGKTMRNGSDRYYIARKYSDYLKYDEEGIELLRGEVWNILQVWELLRD